MVLDGDLPQALGRLVVGAAEADRGLVLLELAGPQLQVEVVALVADLEDLGPREAVDAQVVPEHEQARGGHPYCNVADVIKLC